MPDFFQTGMGRAFYEGTMPRIARALERIADALEQDQQPAKTLTTLTPADLDHAFALKETSGLRETLRSVLIRAQYVRRDWGINCEACNQNRREIMSALGLDEDEVKP